MAENNVGEKNEQPAWMQQPVQCFIQVGKANIALHADHPFTDVEKELLAKELRLCLEEFKKRRDQ